MNTFGMVAMGAFALVVWAGMLWVGITLINALWRSVLRWWHDRREAKKAGNENAPMVSQGANESCEKDSNQGDDYG